MKLAEALQERADLNKKISDLRGRLNQNSLVQEGEKPNEDPAVSVSYTHLDVYKRQQPHSHDEPQSDSLFQCRDQRYGLGLRGREHQIRVRLALRYPPLLVRIAQ